MVMLAEDKLVRAQKLSFACLEARQPQALCVENRSPSCLILLVRTELEARVRVVLRERECLAVADSGAQISIIPVEFAEGLILQQCSLKFIDVNGQEVSVAGQVELELHVGDEKLSHLFVVADIVDTMLLGFDF